MAGHTVAIQFVRSALEPARARGLDVQVVLDQAGIPSDLLAQDAARVTRSQAERLIVALWDATGDELIGIGPKPVPRGTFRMVTLGLIHAPDLSTALARLVEFSGIGMGVDVSDMSDDGRTARLSFAGTGQEAEGQLVMAVGMTVGHRFAAWLIGRQITLTAVDLPGPPPTHAAEFTAVFGVAPTFDAPQAAISFATPYLAAPLVRGEDELLEMIGQLPTSLFVRQDYKPTTASRVRKLIERRAVEAVSVEDVARPLSVSAQHLRRQLREEGTTFRQIRDDVLRDEAIAALVRGTESIEEVSSRLGFSESSAFRRAFRRWTGSPPGSYRPAP
ncbi:AraC family transcriptional regulator [Mycolicibacterium sediminis]|uniref:AraC family transcriptional regulator n=1 Tax=Mycolicibacterium sediminis TaxID=1286180 RepID=A0A7I7QKX4_9MYCO|nr:AraC family transcriptional regulator [Mycolicibacterium sediminis]BBY26526.1 AraC family transcriptional regulator [Mycolicibacterium sediminis]